METISAEQRFCPSRFVWTPRYLVARVARAEFRALYFAHGRNAIFNYQLMRSAFIGGSEANAVRNNGIVCRNVGEISARDYYFCHGRRLYLSLYSSRLSKELCRTVETIAEVQHFLPSRYNAPAHAERYLVTCIAAWAYTRCTMSRERQHLIMSTRTPDSFARWRNATEWIFLPGAFRQHYRVLYPRAQRRANCAHC